MKFYYLILLGVLTAGCANSGGEAENSRLETQVGWMHGNCLAIKNSEIAKSQKITIVKLEEKNVTATGEIIQKAKTGEECYALMDDRKDINVASGYSFYVIGSNAPVDLAIAYVKLEDPERLTFDFCSTAEGINYSIHDKKVEIWSGYYYLGYDSEATCPEG